MPKTNLPKKSKTVTEKRWELELATMATTFGFPFEVINHPQFQSLLLVNAKLFLEKAKLPFKISAAVEMPLNVTLEDHIRARAEGQQKDVLQKLPLNAKLSLSLNLWTSPWRGVEFLVISGYFIDSDWNYREALLGFEPLYRKFTQNPRAVLLGILQAHRIQDRILAITTDLASKHADTVATMQELTQGFAVDYVGVSIIGIPSLTHIIQLSLKELLGKMNAHPQNKNVETVWTERHCQEACGWAQQKDINTTLAKIRSFAVFINTSRPCQKQFLRLQPADPRFVPIQDVQVRWNSTFLMLRRARRLQPLFDQYCSKYDYPQFKLDSDEWRQVDYLLDVTQPFFTYATLLSKTSDSTIHLVYPILNKLFDHLEKSISRLNRKQIKWKQSLLPALASAQKMLREYYSKTENPDLGNPCGIGAILAPQNKMTIFQTREWQGNHGAKYQKSLEDRLRSYQSFAPSSQSTSVKVSDQASQLDQMFLEESSGLGIQSEVERYLQHLGGIKSIPVRQFWKDYELEFPTLAALARDILSIPATGGGVERLSTSAREICYHRRGPPSNSSLKDLVLLTCAKGFDIDESQLAFLEDTRKKIEEDLGEEGVELKQTEVEIEPISDHEEDDVQEPSIKRESSHVADSWVLGNHEQSHFSQLAPGRGHKRPRVSDDDSVTQV